MDASGNVTIAPADIDNGSGDNCGTVTLSAALTTFNCANVGDNTVALTVTDENGGIKTCNATVTVEDNIAPTVVCQHTTVLLDAFGNATITADDIDNGSADNCAIATRVLSKTDFTCADAGTNNVTLTVTDVNGNSESCSAIVTIEDIENPAAVCQNITVQLDASGNATITAAQIDNGSYDNCGIPSLALDITSFDCTKLGTNTVTLTVTDGNGNSHSCAAIVTVKDDVNPVTITATPTQTSIDCYGGDATVTIAVTGGVGTLTYTFDGVPNNSGIFNNIVAGTYNWSVTNSLGCGNASGTFVVQQAGDLSATVALTDVTCSSGSDGTITVTNSSGGSGNYEYSNNGGISWQSSNIFSGLIPGNV
ncbi:MAG: SprB repeat-containing protein [Draconibacterium sp.]|nr:SprB repeat-containing protein [Draconibacterium sp.]